MTTHPDICVICNKHPVREARNYGRHPSSTCGAVCANILSSCDTLERAQARYKREHIADDAFDEFVYPKDYIV